ncbi:hypothetical protein JCM3770_005629 [Rhodotorula araucariae]
MASAAPVHASIPHEGLGLGGVSMPVELGGSARAIDPASLDSRTKASRPLRPRHAPSLSSPPDLAPFAASLKTAPALPSALPSPMSVVGAAPPPAAPASAAKRVAVKRLSGGLISYPVVSRIDSTPTYTPPPAVPPIPPSALAKAGPPPSALATTVPRTDSQKASKTRPPPIKVSNSTHTSFLNPLKYRFGMGAKEKESSSDREQQEAGEEDRSRRRKVEVRVFLVHALVESLTHTAQNQSAISAAIPDPGAIAPPAPSPDVDLNGTFPTQTVPTSSCTSFEKAAHSTGTPEYVSASGIALGSPFHDLASSSSSVDATTSQARPVHRRGTSDESPQILQNAFARIADLDDDRLRPATMYSAGTAMPRLSHARRPSAVASSLPSLTSRQRSKSATGASMPSLAALATVDDAFFPAAVGASTSATLAPSTSRRPLAIPHTLDSANSVGISVREGASTALREVGRAAFGADGVTVSLRGYQRPEDLEVGWTCLPCVDEEGRPYTTWELRLKPRAASAAPAVACRPTAGATVQDSGARARTPSTSASTFLNYRMNAPSSTSSGGSLDHSGMYPPTFSSSRESRRPSRTSPTTPSTAILPRKLSNRSEASSQGGSFSSESSLATALGRKPKLSVSSIATTMTDGHPPFDLEAILAKQSTGVDVDAHLASVRQRINRSSSYGPGSDGFHRARQFSIDEEGIMARAVSFSVGHGVAHRPKSPKHHRFGCYLPPATQCAGAELPQLTQQARRRSQHVREGFAIEGHEEEFAGPTTPSPDRRARKHSFAPGALPPLPAMPPLPVMPSLSASLRGARDAAPGHSDVTAATPASKGFLAAARAAGRRKQSIAPPAALVIPRATGDAGRVSPSSSRTVGGHPSPPGPRHASDVFGPLIDATRTPTKLTTPPPGLPLPELPRARESANSSDRPDSASSGSSSFAGVGTEDVSNADADDSELDPEVEDVENASIRLAHARQARRVMSRWSETDDDDDEDGGGETSWGRMPDAAGSEEGA